MMKWVLCIIVGLILLGLPRSVVDAQSSNLTTVQCGDVIEGEFTELPEKETYYHYLIELEEGTKLTIRGEVVSSFMTFGMALLDETETIVVGTSRFDETPTLDPKVLVATGNYRIFVSNNFLIYSSDGRKIRYISRTPNGKGKGKYRLFIDCILPNGEKIIADSITQATTQPSDDTLASGTGFPGLDPVDFSGAVKIPLAVGVSMNSSITPTGNEIIGYTIDGESGSTLNLSFTRTAGNLNLGIVILSADNKVVFQASLINTKQLTADVTLPSDGQYTIGVFRIDLVPPAEPQATAFQIRVTKN